MDVLKKRATCSFFFKYYHVTFLVSEKNQEQLVKLARLGTVSWSQDLPNTTRSKIYVKIKKKEIKLSDQAGFHCVLTLSWRITEHVVVSETLENRLREVSVSNIGLSTCCRRFEGTSYPHVQGRWVIGPNDLEGTIGLNEVCRFGNCFIYKLWNLIAIDSSSYFRRIKSLVYDLPPSVKIQFSGLSISQSGTFSHEETCVIWNLN